MSIKQTFDARTLVQIGVLLLAFAAGCGKLQSDVAQIRSELEAAEQRFVRMDVQSARDAGLREKLDLLLAEVHELREENKELRRMLAAAQ